MKLIDTVYAHDSNVCCILKLDLLIIILLAYILIYLEISYANHIHRSRLKVETVMFNDNFSTWNYWLCLMHL